MNRDIGIAALGGSLVLLLAFAVVAGAQTATVPSPINTQMGLNAQAGANTQVGLNVQSGLNVQNGPDVQIGGADAAEGHAAIGIEADN